MDFELLGIMSLVNTSMLIDWVMFYIRNSFDKSIGFAKNASIKRALCMQAGTRNYIFLCYRICGKDSFLSPLLLFVG